MLSVQTCGRRLPEPTRYGQLCVLGAQPLIPKRRKLKDNLHATKTLPLAKRRPHIHPAHEAAGSGRRFRFLPSLPLRSMALERAVNTNSLIRDVLVKHSGASSARGHKPRINFRHIMMAIICSRGVDWCQAEFARHEDDNHVISLPHYCQECCCGLLSQASCQHPGPKMVPHECSTRPACTSEA